MQLKKVFIYEESKFYTVAKDVKVQVKFNTELVEKYRLIGYENRVLNTEDFEDDEKDAGEIGADQNITALYEIVPRHSINRNQPSFTIDFRYKNPDEDVSIPLSLGIYDRDVDFLEASDHMKFVGSVASFALVLRDSDFKGDANYEKILNWLSLTNLDDQHGFKEELEAVVQRASTL